MRSSHKAEPLRQSVDQNQQHSPFLVRLPYLLPQQLVQQPSAPPQPQPSLTALLRHEDVTLLVPTTSQDPTSLAPLLMQSHVDRLVEPSEHDPQLMLLHARSPFLPQLLEHFEIIHQTGYRNYEQVKAEAGAVLNEETKKLYHPIAYLEEVKLKHLYQVTDFIVSRAGSGGIFEIAALGKPSIIIPLAGSAQDHQVKNAYTYAKNGAAVIIEEGNLTPHFFFSVLKNTLEDPEQIEKMQKAARKFARPRAGEIIASYIVEYLTQ